MTWLDIGNGWRNLYLLSCLIQMGALGCLFGTLGFPVKKSRAACVLSGVAATPLVQYLWTLLLAVVWPAAPRLVYIGVLPALGALCVLVLGLVHVRRAKELILKGWSFVRCVCHFDKPALIVLCFALCIVLLIGPACVRFMSSMQSVAKGGDAGEYLGLALRYCEERELGPLLEKEETEGHYRGHSHFPSLELFMSYGLFHADGAMGYPYDKPVFTGLGMLIFYAAAAYGALLLTLTGEKKICVLLGVILFNLVPHLYTSVESAPRDIWRILALLWAAQVFCGLTETGGWKRYLGKLILCFAVCFTVMSAHVVCFVVLPFIVIAWVVWRFLHAGLTQLKGAWRALGRSVGLALAGAAGTLAAFSGNIYCFLKWGQMSPWRLMTTYTDAPWYDLYMSIEYKLEETTTHLNFWEAKGSILLDYATPIGTWGFWLAILTLCGVLAALMFARICMKRRAAEIMAANVGRTDGPIGVIVTRHDEHTLLASRLGLCALMVIFTLAPMTGVLDTPIYSFSGSFLKMSRYTLQWFLMANVMTCAALSALMDLWPVVLSKLPAKAQKLKSLPAWLCVLVALFGMVKGLNQTGYTNTFYRYSRGVMESETILLDNGFRERYQLLMAVAKEVDEDQTILINRSGYQYALRSRAYLLQSNPIVPIFNLPLEEIEGALKNLNAAMVASEPDFWDERFFGLSTLSDYLNALPSDQIIETEAMRLYLLDRDLIEPAMGALAALEEEKE